jgi:hypothetical protein
MPPIVAPHASVVTALQNRLIAAEGQGPIARIKNPIHLGRDDEPEPDIALVTRPATKYRSLVSLPSGSASPPCCKVPLDTDRWVRASRPS